MPEIFETAEIAGIQFKNRVLRSATMEDGADEKGFPGDALTKRYLALAYGSIGGIITGFMGVSAAGKSEQPGMVLLDEDDKIEPLRKIVDSVHEAGVPIIAQIAHCGKNGVGGKAFDVNKLSDAQLEEIVAQFIAAAIRAQKSRI